MRVPYSNPIPRELLNPGISQPITLERRSGDWVADGVWKDDEETEEITGRGIVYPSTTDDLEALPEGERVVKSLTLYWPQKFQMNDRIQYEGEQYRVIHIDPWQRYGYHMAIAQVTQLYE